MDLVETGVAYGKVSHEGRLLPQKLSSVPKLQDTSPTLAACAPSVPGISLHFHIHTAAEGRLVNGLTEKHGDEFGFDVTLFEHSWHLFLILQLALLCVLMRGLAMPSLL